jgi:hypothetical protein
MELALTASGPHRQEARQQGSARTDLWHGRPEPNLGRSSRSWRVAGINRVAAIARIQLNRNKNPSPRLHQLARDRRVGNCRSEITMSGNPHAVPRRLCLSLLLFAISVTHCARAAVERPDHSSEITKPRVGSHVTVAQLCVSFSGRCPQNVRRLTTLTVVFQTAASR